MVRAALWAFFVAEAVLMRFSEKGGPEPRTFAKGTLVLDNGNSISTGDMEEVDWLARTL